MIVMPQSYRLFYVIRMWNCSGNCNKKNGWRTNKKSLEQLLTLWEIHTGTPGSESRLRILRMPSACVTVIITSHYLIKDGAGIWCHCHVTDCWVIAPRQSRNLQQTQYLLELTHFVYRWSISLFHWQLSQCISIHSLIFGQWTLSCCRWLKMTLIFFQSI